MNDSIVFILIIINNSLITAFKGLITALNLYIYDLSFLPDLYIYGFFWLSFHNSPFNVRHVLFLVSAYVFRFFFSFSPDTYFPTPIPSEISSSSHSIWVGIGLAPPERKFHVHPLLYLGWYKGNIIIEILYKQGCIKLLGTQGYYCIPKLPPYIH